MSVFRIIWFDDHWNEEKDKLSFDYLRSIRNDLINRNESLTIETKYGVADGLLPLISGENRDCDLLIVDLHFEGDTFNSGHIFRIAQEKGVPFVVFSSFISDKSKFSEPVTTSPLFLGAIDKAKRAEFIEVVLELARFKPLNIVHLSDFHYDSTLTGSMMADQHARFRALTETLKAEHEKKRFDVIIFSGDFAHMHPKEDLNGCVQIIQQIVTSTVKDFSRLLVIPGNHDVEWENFDAKTNSEKPGLPFYEFLQKIYATSQEESLFILRGRSHGYFDDTYNPDSFSWSKIFQNINLEVLGLNTVTTEKAIIGLGKVSEKTMSFIETQWKTKAHGQNLRIAIMHHNILPPFSISSIAESRNILNSGRVMHLLAEKGCNLILSGHCHESYLYNFSYSTVNRKGFPQMKNISYLSTGTSGGLSPYYDKARCFNLISILPSIDSDDKNIIIQPFLYDSGVRKWDAGMELTSVIKK